MREAKARAAPNFAIVKYWGKADDRAMMPAVPSLSLTLDGPEIEVGIRDAGSGGAAGDEVILDGRPVPEAWRARTQRFLDAVRSRAGAAGRAIVAGAGGPPPASGLASSAAFFAALAHAASHAYGLAEDEWSVSDLARQGSVSAARSVTGGWASLDPARARGSALGAETIFPADHWDLAVVIAVVDPSAKKVGSGDGMRLTRDTSPYYRGWVDSSRAAFEAAARALAARDMAALAPVAEWSCLAMHAAAMAARPPVVYMAPATLAAIDRARAMAASGIPCLFTVDAGPQVKVICRREDAGGAREAMSEVAGVRGVLVRLPGKGSSLVPAVGASRTER